MRVIAILDIDPDEVLDSHCGSDLEKSEVSIEFAVESELGWVQESGMYVIEVIAPDGLSPNDTDLGKIIRSKMED